MKTITQEEWISRKISWHPDGYSIDKAIRSLCGKFHINKSLAEHVLTLATIKGWITICRVTGKDFYAEFEYSIYMRENNIIPF